MKRKLLSLLLALTMVLGMMPAIPAAAGNGDVSGDVSGDPSSDSTLTVYYTNDVHTYINKDLSYATIAQMKKDKEEAGENVLLVDAGDHIQGTAYGSMDSGATIVKLMNAAGYDLATLGNHEFDYGMQGTLDTIANADYPYISSNFIQDTDEDGNWENVLDSYKIFEVDGKKIAFVGITTPESISKSTPAYFQDEDGNWIYKIYGGTDGQDLYNSVQKAIDAAKTEGADYVIALGHLGDDYSASPWTSEELIANVSGLDAFIDGHSHSTVPMKEITDKDGKTVVLTQTGSYYDAIGEMTIDLSEGTISTKLDTSYASEDAEIAAMEDAWMADVKAKLGTTIATTDIDFTIYDSDGNRAIRKYETNLGDLNADAYYYYINKVAGLDCDVTIMNGGGIRANINAGNITYESAKTVNPWGNVLCLMKVPGQMILDALEWGAKDATANENGGFLQAAGLTYKIDTSIESTVQKDADGIWTGAPTGQYRVYDVKVYNKETCEYEALDVTKTYTLGGINYTLRNKGDGFKMFEESDGMELVLEGISEDYLAVCKYLSAFTDTDGDGLGNVATANSPLTNYEGYLLNYESATGSGRIVYHTHTPEVIPAVEATCTETGLTEGSKCSECGEILKAQEVVPAKDHTAVAIAAKAATCTKTGLTKGSKCSVCGKILTAQKTVKALGHKYGSYKVTKAATVFATGVKTKTCTVCGYKYKKTISKLKATIKLSATKKTLKVKKTYTLHVVYAKGDSVKKITSSKTSVAKVKKVKTGYYKITAKKKGTSYIKVYLKSGKKASCKVTVK